MSAPKRHTPLRDQITAYLATVEEATADQITKHTSEKDYPSRVLNELNKMRTDIRSTYGDTLRATMARIMRAVFAFGLEENKPALLRSLSADVDLLKHYLTQAPRLSPLKLNFEHRAGSAVELGRLVGGLLKAQQVQP